jgi:predicted transcriptional regulator
VAARKLKQIERQLILYDIFQQNNEDTRMSTILFHLPGLNLRTLQRDIRDLKDAGVLQVYFSRDKNAYINYDEHRDISCYSEGIQKRITDKRKSAEENGDVSPKKKEHLERLKRLTNLMGYEVYGKAIQLYFDLFPEATERMRKRDFEVLRNIGFYAGFDSEQSDYVLYRNEAYGIDNSYGIFKSKKTGKMMRRV